MPAAMPKREAVRERRVDIICCVEGGGVRNGGVWRGREVRREGGREGGGKGIYLHERCGRGFRGRGGGSLASARRAFFYLGGSSLPGGLGGAWEGGG